MLNSNDENQLVDDEWILDTGASRHITCRRDLFWTFQESTSSSISLADNSSHQVLGSRHIKINFSTGVEALIQDVWYVPSLRKNLLSLVKLRKNGLQIIMEDGFCKLNKIEANYQTIATGFEDANLLKLQGKVVVKPLEEVSLA